MARGGVIFNPDVQSDIDMKNTWKFLNLPSSGSSLPINASIYVDPVNGTSGGVRGQSSPFQTLAQAVAVVQAGDSIIMRPGNYTGSGAVTISVNNVTISAYGAKITASATSDISKIIITGSGCKILGLEIDGTWVSGGVDSDTGMVDIGGSNCVVRDCYFHNTLGYPIRFLNDYSGLIVSNCRFENGNIGVKTPRCTTDILGATISECIVADNRNGGIRWDANDIGGKYIYKAKVFGNTLTNNQNLAAVLPLGIELFGGHKDASIIGNTVTGSDFGISMDHCFRTTCTGNVVRGGASRAIEVATGNEIVVSGNEIDGQNDSGTLVLDTGISVSTPDSTSADIVITGNSISNLAIAGTAINIDTASRVLVVGNNITTTSGVGINTKQSNDVTIGSNNLVLTSSTSFFIVDAGGVGQNRTRIVNNSIWGTGSQCVTIDSQVGAFVVDDTIIKGNNAAGSSATPTIFFSAGFVLTATANGGTITNTRVIGNLPPHPTNQYGWLNDGLFESTNTATTSANFDLSDHGTKDTTAVRVLSDSGNLYLQYGSGGHIYIRNATGTILGTVTSTGLDFNGLSVATHAVETQNNKGQISGYASLDGTGKVPAAQLPTLSSGTIAVTSDNLKGDGAGNAVAVTATGTGDTVLATSPTLVTPTIGVATATSVNKWTLTAPSTAATLTAGADGLTYTLPEITTKIGFRHIPQNSQSAPYTTVLADSGKHLYHPAADANNRTFTIDSNANVAYPIGTAIMFVNMSANNLSIAITADTMYLAGVGTTGTRTLAQYGKATAVKTGTTEWVIAGVGLS